MDNPGDIGEKIDLLLAMGKFREAEKMAGEAVGRDPQWAAGYTSLARAYAGLGDLDQALEAARDGVRYGPNDSWAYYILGFVQARRGEFAIALATNSEALRFDPSSACAFTARADVMSRLSRYDEALASADAGLRLEPTSWQLLRERAWALYQLDRAAEALACVTAALTVDPLQPAFHYLLGLLHVQRGQRALAPWSFRHFAAADMALREALRLDPTVQTIHDIRQLNAVSAAKDVESCFWYVIFPLMTAAVLAPQGAFRFVVGPLVLILIFGAAGIRQKAVLSTMPSFGLPLPRLPLTDWQRVAGRAYWALFALAMITPVIVFACWLILRIR